MIGVTSPAGEGRILHFDIENRPLSYWVKDNPTAEITAIASCWADDPDSMEALLLTYPCRHHGWKCKDMAPFEVNGEEMLVRFHERYRQADMVSGHYIRSHDLPIINGALMELGLPMLEDKLTSDTKMHMPKKADIPASQEYLLEQFGIPVEKYQMSQVKWREANRLTDEGLRQTYKRVTTDVAGHILLRAEMRSRGLLGKPQVWRPGGSDAAQAALH